MYPGPFSYWRQVKHKTPTANQRAPRPQMRVQAKRARIRHRAGRSLERFPTRGFKVTLAAGGRSSAGAQSRHAPPSPALPWSHTRRSIPQNVASSLLRTSAVKSLNVIVSLVRTASRIASRTTSYFCLSMFTPALPAGCNVMILSDMEITRFRPRFRAPALTRSTGTLRVLTSLRRLLIVSRTAIDSASASHAVVDESASPMVPFQGNPMAWSQY